MAVRLSIALAVFLLCSACGSVVTSETAGTPIVRVVEAAPTTSASPRTTTPAPTTSQPAKTTTVERYTTLPETDPDEPPSILQLLDDTVITTPGEKDTDVVFRFWTYIIADSFNVSLQADGTVVLVEGTSIYDGADVYSTWKLSETGKRLLIEEVYKHTAGRVSATGHALQMSARYYPEIAVNPSADQSLEVLVSRLRDQSWLEDEFISQPAAWTPSVLTFLVSGPGDPDPSAYRWPLAESVKAHIDPTLVHPQDAYDRKVMCLTGADAARAWSLIRSGENHAYIPVYDGNYWSLSYDIAFPGYHLFGNPCIETQ